MSPLVVIGANDVVAREAAALDLEVVHVLLPGVSGLPGAHKLYMDYRNLAAFESFVEEVIRPLAPSAVISLTELGLAAAAVATDKLGTPGVPLRAVQLTRDKYLMRQALQQRAPHLNPAFALGDDRVAVGRLFAAGPVIAKPIDGAGSAGVALLFDPSERDDVYRSSRTLLEQFVDGPEYSVECLTRHGRHTVLGIAEKGVTTGFVECSHQMPPVSLDEAPRELVEAAVAELLNAVEMSNGPSHSELKLTDGGVIVIETHTRLGGDGIADLVQHTTGINWRQLALGWPVDAVVPAKPVLAEAAARVFFTAQPGTVTGVSTMPDLREATIVDWDVTVEPGDIVEPLRSSADRLGSATIVAASPLRCAEAVATLSAARIITTERPAHALLTPSGSRRPGRPDVSE